MKRLGLIAVLVLAVGCDLLNKSLDDGELTEEEVVAALKEALRISADTVTNRLNRLDAYYKDSLIKIVFPPEAIEVKNTLEQLPGGPLLIDELELKMNRAAENAAKEAKPIFFDAITNITIEDGMAILHGSDTAATAYLKQKTYSQLYQAYYPKIEAALTQVGAQQTWQDIITLYNTVTGKNVNTNLADYTTHKALYGLFLKIGEEEKLIRKDPAKRVTDLLRKVFGSLDG